MAKSAVKTVQLNLANNEDKILVPKAEIEGDMGDYS